MQLHKAIPERLLESSKQYYTHKWLMLPDIIALVPLKLDLYFFLIDYKLSNLV